MGIMAVVTTYKGPTNTRGSRIYARGSDYQTHIGYPHDLSNEAVHRAALADWLKKCEETKRFSLCADELDPSNWVAGWLPDGDYVFVFGGE